MLDNIAAVLNINRKGTTHNSTCNDIKVQFWEFCQEHIILLNAYHMTGTDIIAYWECRMEVKSRIPEPSITKDEL